MSDDIRDAFRAFQQSYRASLSPWARLGYDILAQRVLSIVLYGDNARWN